MPTFESRIEPRPHGTAFAAIYLSGIKKKKKKKENRKRKEIIVAVIAER